MNDVEFKQGPLLAGWAIAAGAALVAFGVAVVVGKFALIPAVAIAAVLFMIVGLILGLPRSEPDPIPVPASRAVAPHATTYSAPAPLMAAPAPLMAAPAAPQMAEPAAAPVPLMSAPQRPVALEAARDGRADDLKEIKGVGPVLEKLLHSLGYFHFDQIAAWTAAEVAWVDDNLEGFKGRVTRDDWVPQARILAAGGSTEHSRRVASGEIT
jgi:predicted flap endonuclease-1-like 5' DNA nuclease